MNREKLKEVAGCYFKREMGAEPDNLEFTFGDDGVKEYNIRATFGSRIFDIHMVVFLNRIELIERRHFGKFENAAADAGYNYKLERL